MIRPFLGGATMKHAFKLIGCVALFLCQSLSAVAQNELPSQADLKAAYCIPVLQNTAKVLSVPIEPATPEVKAAMQKAVNKAKDDQNRIRSYLLPRLPHLDVTGIELAMKRGDDDIRQDLSIISACFTAIKNGSCENSQTIEGAQACYSKCMSQNEPGNRMKSCQDLSWLPF